jgi:hypothetical protein
MFRRTEGWGKKNMHRRTNMHSQIARSIHRKPPRPPSQSKHPSKNTRNERKMPQRLPKPGLNRGRVQRAARRAFYVCDEVSTADVAEIAYCRKLLMQERRLEPHDYRRARRALELIAVRVGRGSGQGRPCRWKLLPGRGD